MIWDEVKPFMIEAPYPSTPNVADPDQGEAPLGIDEPNIVWRANLVNAPGRRTSSRFIAFISETAAWMDLVRSISSGEYVFGGQPTPHSLTEMMAIARSKRCTRLCIVDESYRVIEEHRL